MAKKDLAAPGGAGGDEPQMSADDVALAIEKASQKNPQIQMLRERLIKAIEQSDDGMAALARVIRAKLHE